MTSAIRGPGGPKYTSHTQSASTKQPEKKTSANYGYSQSSGFDPKVKSEADAYLKQLRDATVGYDAENLKEGQIYAPALGEARLADFKAEAEKKINDLLSRKPPPSPEEARKELEAIRNEFDSKVMVENFMMNQIMTNMMARYEQALQEMSRNFGG